MCIHFVSYCFAILDEMYGVYGRCTMDSIDLSNFERVNIGYTMILHLGHTLSVRFGYNNIT